MTPTAKHIVWLSGCVFVSMAVTAFCIEGAQIYMQSKAYAYSTDAKRITIVTSSYPVYMVIQSYDSKSRTITAIVWSNPTNSDIPMRLRLADNTVVERQDAIIENGVFTGTREKVSASTAELTQGVHALAHVINNSETLSTDYLLIGDPFPRP